MRGIFASLLRCLGIDPRGFVALTKVLILMDLRGQHYAAATASKPEQSISPLFLVVGQCLTVSAIATLFLFARTDVFFFTFVNLVIGLVVLATTILVEFQEVVLNPQDLETLGHRPVTPRTYAAARLTNLLFYFVLMYLALNLMPLVVGAGLRDSGPWYVPAYLCASLAGSVVVMALVIVLLSISGVSNQLDSLKTILAWTQIILIAVVFYGGQLMLRDGGHRLLVWGAFPPAWIEYLPVTWLARFVEQAAVAPESGLLVSVLILLGVALASLGLTVGRVAWLYGSMHPASNGGRSRPMAPDQVGSLRNARGSWVARGAEERIGFWMCLTMLRRDPDLVMRSITSFLLAVTVVVIGLFTDQFGNPCITRDASQIFMPILAVYLVPLAVPAVMHNLTFCRDSGGSWLWFTAPLRQPAALTQGVVKAIMVWVVTPCCVLLGILTAIRWADPLSALLHALLAWLLSWLTALASLWLIVQALPFSLPPQRGGSLGLPPVPMLALGTVIGSVATLHYLFADQWVFWGGVLLAGVSAHFWLQGRALRRLVYLARPA